MSTGGKDFAHVSNRATPLIPGAVQGAQRRLGSDWQRAPSELPNVIHEHLITNHPEMDWVAFMPNSLMAS
jgi:hypothetical protein